MGFLIAAEVGALILVTVLAKRSWSRIAANRATATAPQRTFRYLTGRSATVAYRASLKIDFEPSGLLISLVWPFSYLSPPFFVPWSEVTYEPGRSGYGGSMACGHDHRLTVDVSSMAFQDALREYMPNHPHAAG
jgi:hypothetical protein